MKKKMFLLAVAAGIAGFAGPASSAKKTFLVIGGGSETGIYYQVALGVCKLVNEKLGSQGYNCLGQPALGSVLNIKAVKRGLLDFGVVQSDDNWQAYNGKEDWKGRPYKGLRSVFTIYPETVMLVTRVDAGITSVNDLRGKRVSTGNPGSGTRENAKDVLRIYGIDRLEDISERGLEPEKATRALWRKRIDAFFYTVGNPWKDGQKLANRVKIRMVPIDAPGIKEFVADKPYYVITAIPGGMYNGVDKDVPTYAVKATLITSEKESEETVYNLVKTVFDNLDGFRKMHPAFASVQPQDMLKGLGAPLHPGALRYYKEKGWK
ncbi:MAG: TAXI family TRAP transporter solute-binding subunit [Candidatus Methylomirabilales bacterium]